MGSKLKDIPELYKNYNISEASLPLQPEVFVRGFNSTFFMQVESENTHDAVFVSGNFNLPATQRGQVIYRQQEKPDTLITIHEPAVKYFGKHHLEPQNPVTMINNGTSFDWVFPFMVFSLMMMACVKYFFYHRMKQFASALFATRFFYQMERGDNIFKEWISFMLSFNFLVVFSLLIWQTLDYLSVFEIIYLPKPVQLIFTLFLATACYLFLKYCFIGFLGWVFKTYYASEAYFKNVIVFNMLIGVLLMPFVFINFYIASDLLLYASWGIFALTNLFKIIRGVCLAYNIAQFSGYYLFLYICGVELAPLLIIARLSADYLKIV